ncbi:MAG: Ig-like domain-containing protein [Lewinellaceae bacterium]|nr:Ig-like domain-containing protein [Saprospiraceae bacterium]MCB9332369.1 Ig-like domain-containing protein [Lewinellaceae bacterium]
MKKLFFALVVFGLVACARPIAPEGGPKDNIPPKVVPEKSTPNLRTRFTERSFNLTFDEWVTLQDAGTQVLVSPPLAKRPEITLKGRTVTFKFDPDEVLRPNTTYTINFGTAVKDLHEGNAAKDLRFVFSTGDVIDSLSVTGIIVEAFSGEPQENISVQLYDTFDDSIAIKERPYYVARSDKSGQYAIPNVRAGRFKVIAIEDADQNMKWDGINERIGFPDSLIQVNDSLSTIAAIRVFKPVPPLRLLSKNIGRYGFISLGYTRPPDTVPVHVDLPNLRWYHETEQDSLLIWYDRPDSVAWELIAGTDTVALRALSRTAFLATNTVNFADERQATPGGQTNRRGASSTPTPAGPQPPRTVNVRPTEPAEISFNTPLMQVDSARCLLAVDSVESNLFELTIDSTRQRVLQLAIDWRSEAKYTLTLLPGALTDFYGTSNADTLRRIFAVPAEKQLGSLSLSVENLTAETAYVLKLLRGGTTLESEQAFVADSTTMRFSFEKMDPVAFTVQVIEDQNGNGQWDPGDYFKHRQPERVFTQKLDALRANWEVEVTLNVAAGIRRRGE